MVCSNPDDCAEIERRRSEGNVGLLAERRREPRQPPLRRRRPRAPHRQPDQRGEEGEPRLPRVLRERLQRHARARPLLLGGHPRVVASREAEAQRDVHPRGHRGGKYPFVRAGVGVVVRDLTVNAVISDMFHGPARDLRDLRELRRGRAPFRARAPGHARGAAQARRAVRPRSSARARYAPRPYEIVVLSDHGQTQGATFKQRNGYGLDDLVRRTIDGLGRSRRRRRGREPAVVGTAFDEATGKGEQSGAEARAEAGRERRGRRSSSARGTSASIYLMDEPRRLTLEEIEERHPKLIPALSEHPDVGFLLVRSSEVGAGRRSARAAGATCRTTAWKATTRWRRSRRTLLSTCSAPTASSTRRTST